MQTITFYSYKGGVGRSLAMANVAKWLSEFKKRVCMIDFDLEAPGLHYKFQEQLRTFDFKRGIVDYIHDFVVTKEVPNSIRDCVHTFQIGSKNPSIDFIPAGNTSNPDYWKKLSAINWNELFYKEDSEGVPFFLDLKEKIRTELNPEFLLIDSRTGISEISGITMSLYADKIVIVAANNDENLFGAAEIIRSINNPENNFFGKTPEIVFVLSRIPVPKDAYERARESSITQEAKRKLNFSKETEINLIHSDRELEVKESLKISYKQNKEVPISEDYLNLFNKLTVGVLTEDEVKKFNTIKEAESFAQQAAEKVSYNDQIELLSKAIDLHPNDEFYLKRGIAYYYKKEYDKALSDFNSGIAVNENDYQLYYYRSLVYRLQIAYFEAIEDLKKVLAIDPKNKEAYDSLAIIAGINNHYDKAIEYADKAIEIDSEYADAFNILAVCYRKKKNYELALKNVYKSLELNPRFAYAYGTLAEIHSDKGNEEEFYRNIELAFMFGAPIKDFLEDEAYKSFMNKEKFKKLLQKYKDQLDNLPF